MRVTTAFNRLRGLSGASVVDVALGAEGIVVAVRLRRVVRRVMDDHLDKRRVGQRWHESEPDIRLAAVEGVRFRT